MSFKVHPHMLRHACGYALANKGIDTRTCRPTSAIARSTPPHAMLRWLRAGLRTFGAGRRTLRRAGMGHYGACLFVFDQGDDN
jgi:hypothetical protein